MPNPPYEPNIYEDLEDKIIAALQPLVGIGIEVVYFPENEVEFKKSFTKPRVMPVFHSATGGDQNSTSITQNMDTDYVQLICESKHRRGYLGVLDLGIRAGDLLRGLKVPNWTKLIIGKFEKDGRDQQTGVWTYNLVIKTTGVSQQVINDNEPYLLPLIP